MMGILFGVAAISFGVKAFTPTGLPLTKRKNLTGTSAKVIGSVFILLGLFYLTCGLLSMFPYSPLFP